jgi:WD40 repeat protein
MAVSPDGKTLALGCQDMTIKLADTTTRKVKTILSGHKFRVWCVAFSADGKRLASAAGSWELPTEPGEVKVWNVSTGKEDTRSWALRGETVSIQAGGEEKKDVPNNGVTDVFFPMTFSGLVPVSAKGSESGEDSTSISVLGDSG